VFCHVLNQYNVRNTETWLMDGFCFTWDSHYPELSGYPDDCSTLSDSRIVKRTPQMWHSTLQLSLYSTIMTTLTVLDICISICNCCSGDDLCINTWIYIQYTPSILGRLGLRKKFTLIVKLDKQGVCFSILNKVEVGIVYVQLETYQTETFPMTSSSTYFYCSKFSSSKGIVNIVKPFSKYFVHKER